jgi:prephenate dehydrogenase
MIDRAKRLWKMLETNVTVTDSITHDKAVALTSHLPHLLSAAIVHAERKGTPTIVYGAVQGKGFRI